jgi:hypothetical protein
MTKKRWHAAHTVVVRCAIKATVSSAKSFAEVQKLSPETQAEIVHGVLGYVADRLADLGYDPKVVAEVFWYLGVNLKASALKSRRRCSPAPTG